MQTMLQLDPPIPVRTVKGDGFALGWFDYGIDYDTLWLVCITATAEMWQLPQSQVRGVKNISMGRVGEMTGF
jgi:hypothetical protein